MPINVVQWAVAPVLVVTRRALRASFVSFVQPRHPTLTGTDARPVTQIPPPRCHSSAVALLPCPSCELHVLHEMLLTLRPVDRLRRGAAALANPQPVPLTR